MNPTTAINMTTPPSSVHVNVDLYHYGSSDIHSSIPFLDHMFDAFSKHGYFNLTVRAPGGSPNGGAARMKALGSALGRSISQSLGDRKGIRGTGFFLLPMDETLTSVSIDLLKKPSLIYKITWPAHSGLGELDGKLLRGFFEAVSREGKIGLTMELRYGKQPHHIAESLFKGFAKALSQAASRR